MRYFIPVSFGLLLMVGVSFGFIQHKGPAGDFITISNFGKQPTMAVDQARNIKVVFGQGTEIYYTRSSDQGQTFSPPQLVAKQPKLALGMTRGPQIITTRDFTVIAAAAHTGKIMAYRLQNNQTQWSQPVNILITDTTAKEGFVAIAAGKENTVYAAWLDMRLNEKNNIFGATSSDGGKTWSKSKLIYKSPEGRVCPCCRLSMAADQRGNIYVMFRNELAGNRDMYLAHSKDGGKTYTSAQKLGMGTWELKGCPMDGGAISMNAQGEIGTTWRRDNTVYYAEPGKMERKIGEGRSSTFVKTAKGNYFAWQQGDNIMALTPHALAPEIIGRGIYPRLTLLPNQQVFGMWEKDGKILARIL